MGKEKVESKIKLSTRVNPDPSDEELLFARQLGLDCVYTWVSGDKHNAAYLRELRRRAEDAGLILWNVGSVEVGKCDKIHLALPERDEKIEVFKRFLRDLSQAGIHTTTFTWEPTGVWSSRPGATRDARTRYVDMDEMKKRPFTYDREYTEEELWENFEYFMEQIIPVAEETDVCLSLHPNDPPTKYPLGGVPCLIRSFDAYKRAFEIAGSPNLGMEFCVGCWLEGGDDFGNLLEAIRYFHKDGRIFIVHFRNVSSPLPRFHETFLDNGYMDMYKVMRTFVEVGYDQSMTLDHTPQFAKGFAQGAGTAYAIGYMRGLIERAEAELNNSRC
jgi:mannonate dehydratase